MPIGPTQHRPSKWGKGRGGRPWRRLVEAVKIRDKYTCQKCGTLTLDGECDHIISESKQGKTEMDNLQWLCKTPCHSDKTEREAAEAEGHTIKPKARINEDGWPA